MLLASLRSRLLAAFLLPSLALFAVAGWFAYTLSRGILEDELGRSLSAQAASAASQLSAERLLSIEPGDEQGEGTRTHRNLLRQLSEVRAAIGARRVFAFDANGRLRVDAGGALPVGAEVPELARDRLELSHLWGGAQAFSQVLFEGSDGRLYKTGYAPLLADGKVVGAMGVEGSAEFFGPLRRLFRAYGLLATCALALLAAAALLTARALTRPLSRLVDAALRIGKGDLDTPVAPEATLEIGILARQLEQMREGLASRDRQLKMMLAGVAHEVRNPIGGIELFAGLLGEELSSHEELSEASSHVGRIQKEIHYLQRIVDDFLAFAREQKLARAPLEAVSLLSQAAELLSADALKKEVQLRVDAQPAMLEADASLLLSAVVNLLKNAVQASAPGQAVDLRGVANGTRYRVEVEDRGEGIAPEVQEQIFEPFFTTREKGTGLGLPLARKIAQAHEGALTVRSRPGQTIFTLELPLEGGRKGLQPKLHGQRHLD